MRLYRRFGPVFWNSVASSKEFRNRVLRYRVAAGVSLNIFAVSDKMRTRKCRPQDGCLSVKFKHTHPKGFAVHNGWVFYLRLYRVSNNSIKNANSFNNRVIEAITRVIIAITVVIIPTSVISAALLSFTPCRQGQIDRKATAHLAVCTNGIITYKNECL